MMHHPFGTDLALSCPAPERGATPNGSHRAFPSKLRFRPGRLPVSPRKTSPALCHDDFCHGQSCAALLCTGNRLEEYLRTASPKSTSRELLRAEYGLLAMFARRLDDITSKGLHAEVSAQEAKQGLLGLHMFLYNIISYL